MLSRLNKVAIVGRPNVGKSTLFNIATNARRAIVKNQPGVTRDIQYGKAEWRGFEFEIIDMDGQRIDKLLVKLSDGLKEAMEE